jgi:hypothetical protein
VVIIRYAGNAIPTISYDGTMSTSTAGGFTVHTITTSGTLRT